MEIALPDPPLADDSVLLRPPIEADAEAICAYCQDAEAVRWTAVPSPYAIEDAHAWIAAAEPARLAGERAEFVIVRAGDGAVVGGCSLPRVDWENRVAEVGYLIAPQARRQGIGTRAVRLLARWGLDDLGFGRVEVLVHPDNEPSRRVAIAAGFTEEGLLRSYRVRKGGREDRVAFSLIRADLG